MTRPTSLEAPTDPANLPAVFAAAFNDRNHALVDELFAAEAMHVVRPGETVAGPERRAGLPEVLRNRLPISVKVRHVYVVGDVALLLNDYVHSPEPGDTAGRTSAGTATDVARRGSDGRWRYVISNPSGVG